VRALLAVGFCAAVLALGGCGGDSDTASPASSATTATAPATTQPTATAPPGSGQGAEGQKQAQSHRPGESSAAKQGGKGGDSSLNAAATVKTPRVSSAPVAGAKAPAPGVKTVPGADDSVQTYGVESDETARTEAALALAAYLDARRREDWAGACEALAQKPKEQLAKLIKSASAQGKEIDGCAGAMAALGGSQQFPGLMITEVLSLRGGGDIPGDPSYLIFTGPPGKTFFSMPMYSEGGWKVGLAVPAELPL
jgi:hypothetical protein